MHATAIMLDNMVWPVRVARGKNDPKELESAWFLANHTLERLSELLYNVENGCEISVRQHFPPVEQAVRRKDFGDLVEAVAGINLAMCGESGPVEIPFSELLKAGQRQEQEERQRAELR